MGRGRERFPRYRIHKNLSASSSRRLAIRNRGFRVGRGSGVGRGTGVFRGEEKGFDTLAREIAAKGADRSGDAVDPGKVDVGDEQYPQARLREGRADDAAGHA